MCDQFVCFFDLQSEQLCVCVCMYVCALCLRACVCVLCTEKICSYRPANRISHIRRERGQIHFVRDIGIMPRHKILLQVKYSDDESMVFLLEFCNFLDCFFYFYHGPGNAQVTRDRGKMSLGKMLRATPPAGCYRLQLSSVLLHQSCSLGVRTWQHGEQSVSTVL